MTSLGQEQMGGVRGMSSILSHWVQHLGGDGLCLGVPGAHEIPWESGCQGRNLGDLVSWVTNTQSREPILLLLEVYHLPAPCSELPDSNSPATSHCSGPSRAPHTWGHSGSPTCHCPGRSPAPHSWSGLGSALPQLPLILGCILQPKP